MFLVHIFRVWTSVNWSIFTNFFYWHKNLQCTTICESKNYMETKNGIKLTTISSQYVNKVNHLFRCPICRYWLTITVCEATMPSESLMCGSRTWTSTRGISPGPSLMTLNFWTSRSTSFAGFSNFPSSPADVVFSFTVISLFFDLVKHDLLNVLLN